MGGVSTEFVWGRWVGEGFFGGIPWLHSGSEWFRENSDENRVVLGKFCEVPSTIKGRGNALE